MTLDQIAEMIRAGEDVRIVDNNSKEDLTTITLAQIIFEEEKKQKSFLPLHAMKNIIQSGGERIEELVTQAQKRVSGVFGRKSDKHDEKSEGGEHAEHAAAAETPASPGLDAKPDHKEGVGALREWFEASQQKLEDWQKKVDERMRHLVEGISPFSALQKEVGSLHARIAELEKKIEHLSGQTGQTSSTASTPTSPK